MLKSKKMIKVSAPHGESFAAYSKDLFECINNKLSDNIFALIDD